MQSISRYNRHQSIDVQTRRNEGPGEREVHWRRTCNGRDGTSRAAPQSGLRLCRSSTNKQTAPSSGGQLLISYLSIRDSASMVATRRMVQEEPGVEMASERDLELTLKKKPVRRATAKTTKASTVPKTTRGRMTEAEPLERPSTGAASRQETDLELEPPTKASKPSVTRRTAARAKQGAPKDTEEIERGGGADRGPTATAAGKKRDGVEVEVPRQTRGLKNGSVRGRKIDPPVEDAPTLPAPRDPKPARQTRTTATKAPPLNPKKITQVSKPTTRTTRNASHKPAAKAAAAKVSTASRGGAKKRTVSDENADVPDFGHSEAETDDVVILSSPPVKRPSTRSRYRKPDHAVESEASMSSRPTTPNDSPAQSFSRTSQAEMEEDGIGEQDDDETECAVPASLKDGSGESEDELCGPKTPMKRSIPGAEARYLSSVQRTIRRYEDEMRVQTPARKPMVSGSKRATPQTQKPFSRPVMPSSEIRPMTVARGMGRALVFKDLRDGAPSLARPDAVAEQEDVSFYPDDNVISTANDRDDEPYASSVTLTVPEAIQLRSPPASVVEIEDDDEESTSSPYEEDEDEFVDPAAVQALPDDLDETVIVHDADDIDAFSPPQPAASFETDDTVIITRSPRGCTDEAMHDHVAECSSEILMRDEYVSPAYRTLFSDTIRQDAPIAVNFDEHLSNARPVLQVEERLRTDVLNEAAPPTDTQTEQSTVAVEDFQMDFELQVPQDSLRRETLNFNDFVDFTSLAEPTERLDTAVSQLADQVEEPPVEEAHDDTNSKQNEPLPEAKLDDHAADDIEHKELRSMDVNGEVHLDNPPTDESAVHEQELPHYALPTISFDARRKSLPAFSHQTPVKNGTRPNTSDGASMPRMVNPFANPWWTRSGLDNAAATPSRARPVTAHATPSAVSAKSSPAKTTLKTPRERFPALAARETYDGHARTVAAPARFRTPAEKSPKRRETFHRAMSGKVATKRVEANAGESTPAVPEVDTKLQALQATPQERFPRLRARQNYEEHAKTVVAPTRFHTPVEKPAKRRETFHKAGQGQATSNAAELDLESVSSSPSTIATPVATPVSTPRERYPKLKPREDYQEHAKTVTGPARFQTPVKPSLKRPATSQKPEFLRKAALKANTPRMSHTPIKTPLKAASMTPSQAPMTPHPAAPLKGVTALVEIFTLEGASASAPFVALLHRLGAKTTRSWSDRVTHVVFKDGSPTTLQRVRLHNKEVEGKGAGSQIHCVNSRWVTDCDAEGTRMDESDEAYAVDVAEVPRGGKRRRKSMEPSALMNLGGNIVRDRKSSFGRSSLGRSPLEFGSPAEQCEVAGETTPKLAVVEKENSPEQDSPATPAWIAAPDQLVQQTAPLNRVRKLNLQSKKGETKNRRLTCWNGGN